jgi:hypothetical protein
MPIVWIHAGPRAGKHLNLSDADAARAVKEGFGQVAKGMRASALKRADKTTPHEAAEAFEAERAGPTRIAGRALSPAPASGGYVTRDVQAMTPSRDGGGGAADDLDAPPLPIDSPGPAAAEPERRRAGRPRKSAR